ncbi:transcriptional regulator FnrL [Paracoccus sp. (in: a-proteobacteria)]|uniref:transcriptional regulator FnrL n=1 Tax=Paracoccus sp. TaxID=267 RepID=UPI00396CEE91
MRCTDCPIRYRAVCAQCEGDELAELEGIKFYRSFEVGQPIVWEGDRMDFVASVVTGVASLTQTLEDGRTQIVGLLLPSDFLGRPGRDQAPYNATAATRVVLCCFRRKPFDQMMRRTPHLAHRLLEMTLDELDAAREWMLLLGRKTAREKIASFIAIVARREAALQKRRAGGRMELELPLSREAMADYLGLTIETVSRQIGALKREGVIELQGKRGVILPDFARLVEESGDDSDGGTLS